MKRKSAKKGPVTGAPSPHPGLHQPADWDWAKEDIRSGKIQFISAGTSMPRVYSLEAFLPSFPMMMGQLWYEYGCGNSIVIWNSFVFEYVRRCGLRTQLHEELLRRNPKIRQLVTGRATADSLPWLLKMGWEFKPEMSRWELEVPGTSGGE